MQEELILEAKDIVKVFPGTRALDGVRIQVRKGEIHALCGENGAGKSTLMNIIGGVFPPTSGEMYMEGNRYVPTDPKAAQDAGIGFVHQELSVCPDLSAAENIFIGRLPKKGDFIDFPELYRKADEVLKEFKVTFSSREKVSNLTVAEQQVIELSRSLSLDCKLLILDEPTSSISETETRRLFEIMLELKQKGISILYISHRMAEIFEVCDRVSVFKDGQYVTTMDTDKCDADDIIRAMVGRDVKDLYPPKSSGIFEDELLSADHFSGAMYHDVSFTLRRGEILGFSGLVGAGRSELMRGICAIDPVQSGKLKLNGTEIKFKEYRNAVDAGLVYVTEDRKGSGLFLGLSIKSNMVSANLKDVSHGIWLDDSLEDDLANRYVKELGIKIPGTEYPISSLSGGNQQKCLVGKWLSTKPKVIIMDEPTRGIDVVAKKEIHQLLRKLAEEGVGVIVVSSELPEVMGVSDRIAVMHEGTLMGFVDGNTATEEEIMRLSSGIKD